MNEALLKQMWEQVSKFDEDITKLLGFQAVAELCAEKETDNAISGAMWLVNDGIESMIKSLEVQQMALAEMYRQIKTVQEKTGVIPKNPIAKKKAKK